MNRLLRKYSKLLLAVFGTGLMVVFLMPQIPDLVSQFGASTTLVASIGEDGKPITSREWEEVQNEMQFLDRMQQFLPPLPLVGRLESPEQYYLLVHEANQAGMIGGVVSGGVTEEQSIEMARQTGFPPGLVRQALTNRAGINRYLVHVMEANRQSDRRLKSEGRRLFDAADTQVVSVKAKQPSDGSTPDDATIQNHFDTYSDINPGEGEHGFGYRLPDRLQIEWLEVPAEAIDSSLTSSEAMSDRELMKFWRRNEALYPGFEDISSIPDTVRKGLLNSLREEYVDEITRSMNDTLRLPRRGFEESGGYLVLPENWNDQKVPLEDVRSILVERHGLTLDPVQTSGEELIEVDALRDLDGIGTATSSSFSRQPLTLSQMAAETKEFTESGLYPIQAGIAGPILKNNQDNLYLFRITETDAARPPHDLEEVRGEIVTDLQRLAHYQELLAQMDEMESVSETDGLEAMATRWEGDQPTGKVFQKYQPGTVGFYLSNGLQPQPSPANFPGLNREDQDAVDAILLQTSKLDHSTDVEDMSTEDRFMVFPSEENLAVVGVRLVGHRPLDRDAYQQLAAQRVIPMLLLGEELGGDTEALRDSFTLETLSDRHNFRFARNDDAANENATAAAATN